MVRMPIFTEDFRACVLQVISGLEAYDFVHDGWQIAPDNHEGIRVSFGKDEGDGWFLLRLSVHDPIMPLNIESDAVGGVKLIAGKLYDYVKTVENVDISALEKIL